MISFGNCPSGNTIGDGLANSCRRAKLLLAELFYLNPGLRSRSPRLGNRKVQSVATAFYLNPGLGD